MKDYQQVLLRMLFSHFITLGLQEYPSELKVSKHKLLRKR